MLVKIPGLIGDVQLVGHHETNTSVYVHIRLDDRSLASEAMAYAKN